MFTGFIILTFTLNFSDNYGFILLKIYMKQINIVYYIGKVEWSYVFMFLFLSLLTFIDPSFYQRVNSARDLKTIQKVY